MTNAFEVFVGKLQQYLQCPEDASDRRALLNEAETAFAACVQAVVQQQALASATELNTIRQVVEEELMGSHGFTPGSEAQNPRTS